VVVAAGLVEPAAGLVAAGLAEPAAGLVAAFRRRRASPPVRAED